MSPRFSAPTDHVQPEAHWVRADPASGARGAQNSPQHGLQVGVPPLLSLQRALIQGSEDGLVKCL